jgi:hypothetical protein
MGGACSNLAQLSNPCDLAACTQSFQTFPKSTASHSVQAMLVLLPGTHFRGNPVNSVFIKLFIQPQSLTPTLYKQFETAVVMMRNIRFLTYNQIVNTLQKLRQELIIYGSVIQPIVTQQICPFFTNVYSTSHNCHYSQLESMLGPNLYESIGKSLFSKRAIGLQINKKLRDLLQNIEFGVIVSQVGGNISLERLLVQEQKNKTIGKIQWFQLLFQVAWGIYVLQVAGVTHNDLHANNILVEVTPNPLMYCLCKNNPLSYFTFQTSYKAQIYDFDRSTWSSGMTGKDLYQVVLTLLHTNYYYDFKMRYVLPVAKLLYPEGKKGRLTQMLAIAKETHFLKWEGKPLPLEVFADMRPMMDILYDLARLGQVLVTEKQPVHVTKEQLYYADSNLFGDHVVKIATVAEEVAYISVRDLEVTITQDEYDLEQLKYAALK